MPYLVSKRCCCVDLRTGSFIIGYVGLVWSLIASVIYFLGIVGAEIIESKNSVPITSMLFGISLIRLYFLLVLVVGLHKLKQNLIKAFLLFCVIFVIMGIILFIWNVVNFIGTLDIVINLLDILFFLYFWVMIRSYYYSRRNNTDDRRQQHERDAMV